MPRAIMCSMRSVFVAFLLLLSFGLCAGRDFYKILGVKRSADDTAIKKAYRKLAMKWHPDKVEESEKEKANAKFADISAAYETLSEPDKRRIYDQVGEEGMKNGGGGGPPGGGGSGFPGGGGFPGGFRQGGGGGHQQFHFGGGGGGGFTDPFHMFSQMFGSGGGGGGGFPSGMQGQQGFPRGGMPGGMPHGGGGAPPPPPPILYSAKTTPDVKTLTRATFNGVASRKARGSRLVLLHLYAPSSPGAAALAPALQKLALTLKGAITVAAVNCAAERAVCTSAGLPPGGDNALRLLHGGGDGAGAAEDLDTPPLVAALRAGRPPLKALAPVWEAVVHRVPSRVGTLPASRAALDKLARRCLAPAAARRRAVHGCVVLFTANSRVSPMYAALSTHTSFDAAGAPGAGGAGDPPAFVFAQAEVPVAKRDAEVGSDGSSSSSSSGAEIDVLHADAAGAVDLGVKQLPALVLLLGSSLEDWRLGTPLTGEDLRRGAGSGDEPVRGRLLAPKAALESTAAMASWLQQQSKALQKL